MVTYVGDWVSVLLARNTCSASRVRPQTTTKVTEQLNWDDLLQLLHNTIKRVIPLLNRRTATHPPTDEEQHLFFYKKSNENPCK
jgi:hypothetical protein